MAAAKILLIEDNKEISDYNREYLEQKGYDVSSAATLKEARRKLEFFQPDMLVLDIMMPDGCGIDFCRAIRADWSASAPGGNVLRYMSGGGRPCAVAGFPFPARMSQ